MKALVGAFNQEKALVGAFSVIVKTDCGTALLQDYHDQLMVGYDADRVDWLNQCTFACKLCQQEFQFR